MNAVCVTPGCSCPTSLRQEAEAASGAVAVAAPVEVVEAASVVEVAPAPAVKRGPGRPPQPCGTVAAYKRHIRAGEQPCERCKAAQRAYDAARVRDRSTPAPAPVLSTSVHVDGSTVVIVSTLEDAAMLAAAVLDRALTLEANRHTASSGRPATEQTEKAAALRALHHRISQAVRSVG